MARLTTIWGSTWFRLTIAVGALFALGSIAVIAAVYWHVNGLLTNDIAQAVQRDASRLEAAAGRLKRQDFLKHVTGLQREEPSRLLRVVSAPRAAGGVGNLSKWPSGMTVGAKPSVFRYKAGGARSGLAIGLARDFGNGLTVVVARDAGSIEELARTVGWWFLFGVISMAVVGLLFGIALNALVMGRIQSITSTSERIMSGRLSERITLAGTGDELDHLAVNLNRMLDRIEELMAGFREVSDNIAHDLKTPLNRLRNRAEDALSDHGRERETLEQVLVDADDLIRTFNALLQIARLEAGATDTAREEFVLNDLVGDIVEFYEPLAEDDGGRITFAPGAALTINGNRQLLAQALTNLFENALKYGGAQRKGLEGASHCSAATTGSDIAVQIIRDGNEVCLSVGDRGAGIREADHQVALKRFGRLDSSRSLPGSGLGLSLVNAVARLHGGRVELADNNPGLRVTMVLPADGKTPAGV